MVKILLNIRIFAVQAILNPQPIKGENYVISSNIGKTENDAILRNGRSTGEPNANGWP
jgi:hypothetical protein